MHFKKIKYIFFIIAVPVFLGACKSMKELPGTSIKPIDGIELVENSKEKISIRYNGDYWFHKLSKESTLNWNNDYVLSFKTHRPKIIYCTHTTGDPYYTSVALAYDKINNNENVRELIFSELKKKLQLENYRTTVSKVNGIEVTSVSYNLPNKKLKITTTHAEFFLESATKVIRIAFWTTDADSEAFNREASDMINTLTITK